MDDGAPPPEEDFTTIPLIDRSTHKNWKARLSAYTELISKFAATASDDDPFSRPYIRDTELLKKWVTDSNVVSQEKGVEALCSLLEHSGETAASTRSEVMPSIVDKCFGSTRAGTKAKAVEAALLYVEAENTGEFVVLDVLKGLDAKQPKLVAQSVKCLGDIVTSYGIKPLGKLQPLLKSLTKIFGHTDKTVRAEGTILAQALHQNLGPALTPALQELKPVQQKELAESFAAMDAEGRTGGSAKPTRWTKKEQKERAAVEMAGGDLEEEGSVDEGPPDADAFLDPVDIIKLFPGNFLDVICSPKWKDKNDLLEECLKIMEIPTNAKLIDNPDLRTYVDALGKRMTDTNVNVVANAAKVIQGLATGVMDQGFGKYRGLVMLPMLERLKEKKKNVTEAIGNALDAVFKTVSVEDIVEDCATACGNKNPQVKEGSLSFVVRCLSNTKQPPRKQDFQTLADLQVSALGDADATIRTAAADGLGCFMKIFGERALNPYLEKANDLQKTKVRESFEKATVQCKPGGAAPPPKQALAPSSAANNRPPAPKAGPPKVAGKPLSSGPLKENLGSFGDECHPPQVKATPRPVARPVANKSTAPPTVAVLRPAPAAASSKPNSKGLAASPNEPVRYKYSQEDAEAQAADIVPKEIQTGLADAQWKERLASSEQFVTWLEEGAAAMGESEILFRFMAKTPGWNEKNFQVSAKVYQAMSVLAEKSPSFGKASAALAIPHLTEKLGDLKLKKPAGDTLIVFAEKTSLAFVLAQSYEPMGKQKAPKAQADALTWIKQALIDFGIAGLALRDMVAFLKTALQSSNAAVRSAATSVLVTLRLFVGTDVASFLEDLNPQLQTTINSEFAKVEGQAAPEPTRTCVDFQEVAATGGSSQDAVNPLDEILPRVDLDKLVDSSSAVSGAASANWKDRKEGLEGLLAQLDVKANTRLKPTMGEIGSVLKGRCADTNLSVRALALDIISKIAVGMGPPFEKHAAKFTTAVGNVTADQKAPIRLAAVATLKAMANACEGLDSMVSGMATSLESTNPALRASLLGFIGAEFQSREPAASIDLAPLALPVLSALEDRNGDVRKAAQTVLPFIVSHAGYNYVVNQASSLKAASRATVLPLIQAARDATVAAKPSAKATTIEKQSAAVAKPSIPSKAASIASSSSSASLPGRAAVPGKSVSGARGMALKTNALRTAAPSSTNTTTYEEVGRVRAVPNVSRIGGGMRPPSVVRTVESAESSGRQSVKRVPPLRTVEIDSKAIRAKRDGNRWSAENSNASQLLEMLQKQMEPHCSPELATLLFSVDRSAEKDHFAGLAQFEEFYDQATDGARYGLSDEVLRDIRLANVDLPLKYTSIRLHDGSTQMVLKCLDVVLNIVETVDRTSQSGFTDAESNVLLPVLISKLGDNKFKDKLAGIFNIIDRTVAGSKVAQYYQNFGITSTSAKTRAAAMEMLALLIKRRGDIISSSGDGGKLYRRIAEFIGSPDNATRTAALDCIAYLYKIHGDAVYQALGELKSKDRDLLSKRIEKLASASVKPSGIPTHVRQSPPRANLAQAPSSPVVYNAKGSSAASSPGSDHDPAPQRLSLRPQAPAPPTHSRDHSGVSQAAANDVRRSTALSTASTTTTLVSNGSSMQISTIIGNILTEDPDRSVDALKRVQQKLERTPGEMQPYVQDLIEAVHIQLQQIFASPDSLSNMKTFRLTKHLVQTLSNFCDHSELVEEVNPENMMILLEQLSIGLLRTDMATGDVKDMSRYLNMTILRLFATGRRITIFNALLTLLLQLATSITAETKPDAFVVLHAELILKCIWKRSRTAEEDFTQGLLDPGDMLRVIESFLVEISPKEWRQRGVQQFPLGDMPLRTIKVLLQHIVSIYGGEKAYLILSEAFPEDPDATHVYTYIYRLVAESTSKPVGLADPQTAAGPSVPRRKVMASESALTSPAKATEATASQEQDELDVELEDILEIVSPKDGGGGKINEGMSALHRFLKDHPEKQGDFDSALNARLGDSSFKRFIKRKLQTLQQQGESSEDPAAATTSPSVPTSPPPPTAPAPAASATPNPTLNNSNGASPEGDAEQRIRMLKSKFAQIGAGSSVSS